LEGHDYSSPGEYFITICVRNQIPFFGKIENRKMILNDIGIIANKFWLEIPHHYQNIKLDEYIIMPDHIHGILIINSDPPVLTPNFVQTPNLGVSFPELLHGLLQTPNLGVSFPESLPGRMDETPRLGVSTIGSSSDSGRTETPRLGVSTGISAKNPNWKSNSIGSIINQFKRICTLNIQKINHDFEWHPRFHDRIIRNNRELNCIRKYIRLNPSKFNR
jgi:hypothetical protein